MGNVVRDLVVVADPDDRASWLLARRAGLGGSDMAAILDEDPYKAEVDVWADKHGRASVDVGERGDMGNRLEPFVLDLYAQGGDAWPERKGPPLRVVKPPLVAHPERSWQRGSADGLVMRPDWVSRPDGCDDERTIGMMPAPLVWRADGSSGVLGYLGLDLFTHGVEVKTHGWGAYRAHYDITQHHELGVPGDKRIQVAWYQALWGLGTWDLIALVDTHLRRQWTIHRNAKLEADLLEIGEAWWNRHVVKGEKPQPDGSKAYGKHLAELFAKTRDHVVEAPPELEADVRRLREVKRIAKELEREEEKIKQRIQSVMGEATELATDLGRITWTPTPGRLAHGKALEDAIKIGGLTVAQRADLMDRHTGAGFRTFRVPAKWSKE